MQTTYRESSPLAESPMGDFSGPNPRRAIRQAKRRGRRGGNIANRKARACSRSLKRGKGCINKKGWKK